MERNLDPEIVTMLSQDSCGKFPDGILALSSKSGETLQALGELYSSRIKAAASEIADEGITGPLALLSGFAEKMPSLENLKDARAAAFLAEFYLFAAKRGVPGKDEAGRMIIELADMVMSPEDALGRLSELAGVQEAAKPQAPSPAASQPNEIATLEPAYAPKETKKPEPAAAPEAPPGPAPPAATPQKQYPELGTVEEFVSLAQRILSSDPEARSEAEARLSALGADPGASVIRRMIADIKSKKMYAAAVSRGDKFGIERFVKFDVPKLAREWVPEFEKAAGLRLAA
jgi:hypothetical protein